jgi:hypothetical protein
MSQGLIYQSPRNGWSLTEAGYVLTRALAILSADVMAIYENKTRRPDPVALDYETTITAGPPRSETSYMTDFIKRVRQDITQALRLDPALFSSNPFADRERLRGP